MAKVDETTLMAFASKFYPKIEKKGAATAGKDAGASPSKPGDKPASPDPRDTSPDKNKPGDKGATAGGKDAGAADKNKPGDKGASPDKNKPGDKGATGGANPTAGGDKGKPAEKDKKADATDKPSYVNNTVIVFSEKNHAIKKDQIQLKGDKSKVEITSVLHLQGQQTAYRQRGQLDRGDCWRKCPAPAFHRSQDSRALPARLGGRR